MFIPTFNNYINNMTFKNWMNNALGSLNAQKTENKINEFKAEINFD
jgi:predicted 2-oxoglutarate/Fe(II)-dependent dioxygenase YbiX